jgi:hypothetical protein
VGGLHDQSRAPESCPHQTPAELVDLILEENGRYGWGARKVLKRLRTRYPERAWPVLVPKILTTSIPEILATPA